MAHATAILELAVRLCSMQNLCRALATRLVANDGWSNKQGAVFRKKMYIARCSLCSCTDRQVVAASLCLLCSDLSPATSLHRTVRQGQQLSLRSSLVQACMRIIEALSLMR